METRIAEAGLKIGEGILCRCDYVAYPRKARFALFRRWYFVCMKCWTFSPRRFTKAGAARAFIAKLKAGT